MKRLQSSCYALAKSISPRLAQVQISRTAPTWWHSDRKMMEYHLAPTLQTFQAMQSGRAWKPLYREQLDHLRRTGELQDIINRIPENAVLLSFGQDAATCHRSELAKYLAEHGLAEVTEMPA